MLSLLTNKRYEGVVKTTPRGGRREWLLDKFAFRLNAKISVLIFTYSMSLCVLYSIRL